MHRRTVLTLLPALAIAATGAAPAFAAEGAPRAAGDQPFASYWHPASILGWNPASDPDARFNRSRVPLRSRSLNPQLKANANARANEGRVVSLVSFGPTSNNPSQGSLDPNYYAFGYWQYIDTLVFWGGSASEGLILAPNGPVVDAAHRNGVKVYGTVFFPPAAYGGQLQWVRDFVVKSGSTYPVADKLNQVADHYGFEGWFINQETGGGDTALATELRSFMKYARAGGTEYMWYDSMVENGSISWQNALNSSNDAFLSDPARVSDSMFLNFNWSASGLSSSRSLARSLGRNEYELYSGVDTEANGYNTSVGWDAVFPAGAAHVTSLGFYRPEWTWKSSTSPADFRTRDSRYWIGANGDPSNTSTTSPWKGLANYIAESTPITAKPFVTGFNAGHGDVYHVGGVRVRTGGWNNLAVQDVPPTYRWIVNTTGTKLTPSLDFTDAYEGGSSLRITGRLDALNTVRLYQTALPVASDTKLSIVVKTPAAGATNLKAAIAFTNAPTAFTAIDLGSTGGTGWERKTLDLSAHAGKTIAQIALQAQAAAAIASYDVRVGQIAVYDGVVDAVGAPTGLTVLGATDVSATRKSLRLAWTPPSGAVHHFDVYRRDAGGGRTYLGATPNDAYFVPQLDRAGTEASTTIEVEAVSPEYGRSSAATASVSWSGAPSESNLALNRPATASGQANANEGPAKAVNGSVSGGNTDKWCTLTSEKWLEVDLGSSRSLTRFVVKHAGAGGESASWNTRAFSIQTRNATADAWATAATVTANTASTTTHNATATARHVRLVITQPTQNTDPAARIYEFEAWGT